MDRMESHWKDQVNRMETGLIKMDNHFREDMKELRGGCWFKPWPVIPLQHRDNRLDNLQPQQGQQDYGRVESSAKDLTGLLLSQETLPRRYHGFILCEPRYRLCPMHLLMASNFVLCPPPPPRHWPAAGEQEQV